MLELVANGRSNKQIAAELGITEQAAKDQVSVLLQHLDARNRAELGDVAATRRFVGTFALDPEWHRFLFRDAPIGIAVVAGAEHRFVAFNERYRAAAGGRDLVGRPYGEVFPADDDVCEALDRVYLTGERQVDAVVLQPLPDQSGAIGGIAIFNPTMVLG